MPFVITFQSAAQTVDKVAHEMGTAPQTVYCRHMNKTTFNDPCSMAIQSDRLEELNMFMFDTMASAEMAVDWFCDRFNVSATDEVIDLVCDAHFAMFADQ